MNTMTLRLNVGLVILGILSTVCSIVLLVASIYARGEISSGFFLGAFFLSLIVAILAFGFAKVFQLLDQIRVQTDKGDLDGA